MEVKLLSYTSLQPVIEACNMPYQSRGKEKLVKSIWNAGHRSVARHGMASFSVKDVSVSLLTQISRHPHINLTVQSSRYCDMSDKDVVVPDFMTPTDEIDYLCDMDEVMDKYRKWIAKEGYKKEQQKEIAKMFIPKALTLDLVVSGNYQALYEFLELRLCIRAEWEIRNLANLMANNLIEVVPSIFRGIDCRGAECGVCPEIHEPCGKFPVKRV